MSSLFCAAFRDPLLLLSLGCHQVLSNYNNAFGSLVAVLCPVMWLTSNITKLGDVHLQRWLFCSGVLERWLQGVYMYCTS